MATTTDEETFQKDGSRIDGPRFLMVRGGKEFCSGPNKKSKRPWGSSGDTRITQGKSEVEQ
ncbi:hypothetical protein D8780_01125 [Notoacmeibacter ruber]|uniref:Uncharacterized protein n=1 Tax=Notoacmeibacter ruber TaxID=2670375 RepID=A0A3L7J8S1_9HYPH|nr:hypothetical protein D8780_01125 [Notoacmeibacter ruber]